MAPARVRRALGALLRLWPGALGIACALLVWEWGSRSMDARLILPGPVETLIQTFYLLCTPSFWWSLGASTLRTAIAFAVSLIIALPLGLLMGHFRFWRAFFAPLVVVLRSTPVISVILLGLLWFSADVVPVWVGILMVLPILVGATAQGVQSIDPLLREMAATYRMPPMVKVLHLTLPAIRSALHAASRSGLGIGWKVVAAAEVLSQPGAGLGARLQDARVYLDTAKVFGITIMIIVLSALGDLLIDRVFTPPNERRRNKLPRPGDAANATDA